MTPCPLPGAPAAASRRSPARPGRAPPALPHRSAATENALRGVSRRRTVHTTVRDERASPAPDLVRRDVRATRPNRLWVADITCLRTDEGFLYLACVLDVCTRRVVGWAMRTALATEIVTAALEMALQRRQPEPGLIHHSDHGSHTSFVFGARCRDAGIVPSMGTVGDCFDNAMAESFFATPECELLDRETFRTREAARTAIFDYLETWYNPRRRHSALDYVSPMEYEWGGRRRSARSASNRPRNRRRSTFCDRRGCW